MNETTSGRFAAWACHAFAKRNALLKKISSLSALAALAVVLSLASSVYAQSNVDGAVSGKTGLVDSSANAKCSVLVESLSTGVSRTVSVNGDGSFRAGSLPPGTYKISLTNDKGITSSREVAVVVGTTATVSFGADEIVALEKFVVSASTVNPVDFQRTESVSVFTDKLLKEIPVGQSLNAVALLAPGTTQGDSAFGSLISFAGSSVAENAYFINGFNVSNFRNGLDPSIIPFEFYNQFEIKTGGYSAEFGRSTGGVVNATTKSGSNEFHGGVSVYFTPNMLRAKQRDVFYTDGDGSRQCYTYNSEDQRTNMTTNIYVSGPVIKNMLFLYGIYTMRNNWADNYASGGSEFWKQRDDDPFWGGKLDFYPFKGHHLEYTAFSDKASSRTTAWGYDLATGEIDWATVQSKTFSDTGGRNDIFRYTANLTEDLTFSALYGKNRADQTNGSSEDTKPGILDGRTGMGGAWVSGNPDLLVSSGYDQRKALRFDLEYAFDLAGSHRLRVGYDSEDNTSVSRQFYTGGLYWRYYTTSPGSTVNGAIIPAGVTQIVRERIYDNSGSFGVKTSAIFVEDNYTLLNDRLLLRLGLRNETFDNKNSNNQTFIKVDNQLAPRLGVSYDLFGDKKTKVFLNYGRYHLPIASNTNIRMAGGELFTQEYYVVTSINAGDYTPVKGAKIGGTTTYSDGSIKDPTTIVDQNIKPMYQDEWIVGIQHELSKKWTVGVRAIVRDLKRSIDDVIVDQAIDAYAARKGITNYVAGDHAYVLTNPGAPISFNYDIDGDGDLDKIDLTSADLGFPKSTRKYYAAEIFVERLWDEKWNAQFSYTWSHSYGNTEGYVKSDNGQSDAGITSDFDAIGLIANSYGDLPNDRRHQFKLFGSYALTKELQIGLNTRLTSGRPKNKLGVYPYDLDPIASGYGAEGFWTGGLNGSAHPRGSQGRTPWTFNNDLSLVYKPIWGKDRVRFNVEVFNIFNAQRVTEPVEQFENTSGGLNYTYGLPSAWQASRSVRVSAVIEF